jgi:hypothetical protein
MRGGCDVGRNNPQFAVLFPAYTGGLQEKCFNLKGKKKRVFIPLGVSRVEKMFHRCGQRTDGRTKACGGLSTKHAKSNVKLLQQNEITVTDLSLSRRYCLRFKPPGMSPHPQRAYLHHENTSKSNKFHRCDCDIHTFLYSKVSLSPHCSHHQLNIGDK